jgi:hypothetical protein
MRVGGKLKKEGFKWSGWDLLPKSAVWERCSLVY